MEHRTTSLSPIDEPSSLDGDDIMNRKHLILTTAAALLVGSASLSMAAPFGGYPFAADRVDAHLQRMTERLDLTSDQQAHIRSILQDRQTRRNLDRQQTRAEIDAVLSPEQRTARDSLIAARVDQRLSRMAGRLDLSTTQQDELRALMLEQRDDPDLAPGTMRERLMAVLDDEQQARLGEARGRGRGRPGAGGAWCW
jgi:Spy/CpxP family protein refolding chaperone